MTEEQKHELENIRQGHGGILQPLHVVNAAKSKQNALHPLFEWDDSKAAHEYRIHQARDVIRSVRVAIANRDDVDVVVHKYVSLAADRLHDGGGYREITEVIEIDERRMQLIETACQELGNFVDRYAEFVELGPVTTAIREFLSQAKRELMRRVPTT